MTCEEESAFDNEAENAFDIEGESDFDIEDISRSPYTSSTEGSPGLKDLEADKEPERDPLQKSLVEVYWMPWSNRSWKPVREAKLQEVREDFQAKGKDNPELGLYYSFLDRAFFWLCKWEMEPINEDEIAESNEGNFSKAVWSAIEEMKAWVNRGSKEFQENRQEYEVETVIRRKIEHGITKYLLKWKGYDESYNTWEAECDIAPQLIAEFKKRESYATQRSNDVEEDKEGTDDDSEDDFTWKKSRKRKAGSIQSKREAIVRPKKKLKTTITSSVPKLECIDGHKCNREMLAEFWYFVCERQHAAMRRLKGEKVNRKLNTVTHGTQEPWSTDEILVTYRFTNVYREMDVGSIYYLQQIKETKDKHELLWKTIVYRVLNRVSTFERSPIHGIPCSSNIDDFVNWCGTEIMARRPIFTGRHQNNGFAGLKATVGYLHNHISSLTTKLLECTTVKKCCKVLKEVYGMGRFLSWQVFCDLEQSGFFGQQQFQDNWVLLGPGAISGLEYIFPASRSTQTAMLPLLLYLQRKQPQHISNFGLTLQRWNDQWLSATNIEHSLCEFQKYIQLKYTSHGKLQRRPREERSDDLTLRDQVLTKDGFTGRIRYIGDVDFADGMWVGIELDDEVGEHDGKRGERRYFTCDSNRGVIVPFADVQLYDPRDHYVVKEILAARKNKNEVEYLVSWEGYEWEDNTWEPERNVVHTDAYASMHQLQT